MYERYESFRGPTDAYTLTAGRLHRTMAPANTTPPYIVVMQIGGTIAEMFSGESIEDVSLQMSVYDEFRNDISRASAIMQSLIGIFNWCTLAIPGIDVYIRMRREGMQRELIEDQDYVHVSQDWFLERQVPAWR